MKKREKLFPLEDPVLQRAELCEPRRKKHNAGKMKDEEVDTKLVQVVEDHEAGGGGESHEAKKKKSRKKKKKMEEVVPMQIVENQEAADGGELHKEEERKKKRNKMEIKTEEFDIAAPTQIVAAVDGGESHEEKEKRRRKKMEGVDTVTPMQIVEELHEEKKKRRKKKMEGVDTVTSIQIVEELHKEKKKRKKKMEGVDTVTPMQIVEELHEEKKKRRKKKKMEGVDTITPIQIVEELHEEKKKKRKVGMKVETVDTVPLIVEPVQIVEVAHGGESHKEKRRTTKKKLEMEEVATLDDPILQLAESCGLRRKQRKTRKVKVEETGDMAHTLQSVKSCETGSCGELQRRSPEVLNTPVALGIVEPHKKKRTKKETSGNNFVYGKHSAEEDAKLKQAIFDFIREKGWGREDGIHKIIHSKSGDSLGCWPAIGKCLPHRAPMGLYARAHKLLGVHFGRWTSAEIEALKELHSRHGSQWNKISQVIGRDRTSCCLKWHNSVKWSIPLNQKIGRWSQEERKKLCTLVLKFLHEKCQLAEKGQLHKNHRGTRDDINWVYIAEHMHGRSGVQCANQWYFLSRINKVIC